MITVVTGPPCSGKSTYVREHARPGDVVIDFDVIAQAFGSAGSHAHSPLVRQVTHAARKAAIESALGGPSDTPVWIVDCNISPRRMAQYTAVGAHIVAMTADARELHRRAARERPRAWHKLIDEWRAPEAPGSRQW